jgi:hypothetical protein
LYSLNKLKDDKLVSFATPNTIVIYDLRSEPKAVPFTGFYYSDFLWKGLFVYDV